ncbi:MAG: hypothetical protein JWR79_972 [Tardiphaga sp.]|nr:hypothetical protein [Tardiphaga sp.]
MPPNRPNPDVGSAASGNAAPLLALTLTLALAVALGLRAVLSLDALAPVVATLMFVLAAATGCAALLLRKRTMFFDLAGLLTFIGVFISIMIESDQMTRLLTLSEPPE